MSKKRAIMYLMLCTTAYLAMVIGMIIAMVLSIPVNAGRERNLAGEIYASSSLALDELNGTIWDLLSVIRRKGEKENQS